MLNDQQVIALTSLHGGGTVQYNGKLFGIVESKKDRNITCKYKKFKRMMGLDDIRFHWMLSNNIYMAGGAVIAWIWPEAKNEDFDFYFRNKNAARAFENLVISYGCSKKRESSLTDTYEYDGTILQLVGVNERETQDYYGHKIPLQWFKEPHKILDRFDFHVSKFAVDCDNVYTTTKAIESILTRALTLNMEDTRDSRLEKYVDKGFLPIEGVEYERTISDSWY